MTETAAAMVATAVTTAATSSPEMPMQDWPRSPRSFVVVKSKVTLVTAYYQRSSVTQLRVPFSHGC